MKQYLSIGLECQFSFPIKALSGFTAITSVRTCILSLKNKKKLCNLSVAFISFNDWLWGIKIFTLLSLICCSFYADLQRQKLPFQCIHIKHASWWCSTPSSCISYINIESGLVLGFVVRSPSTVPMNVAPQSFFMRFCLRGNRIQIQLNIFEGVLSELIILF